jgi:hypothetical protein
MFLCSNATISSGEANLPENITMPLMTKAGVTNVRATQHNTLTLNEV